MGPRSLGSAGRGGASPAPAPPDAARHPWWRWSVLGASQGALQLLHDRIGAVEGVLVHAAEGVDQLAGGAVALGVAGQLLFGGRVVDALERLLDLGDLERHRSSLVDVGRTVRDYHAGTRANRTGTVEPGRRRSRWRGLGAACARKRLPWMLDPIEVLQPGIQQPPCQADPAGGSFPALPVSVLLSSRVVVGSGTDGTVGRPRSPCWSAPPAAVSAAAAAVRCRGWPRDRSCRRMAAPGPPTTVPWSAWP